MKKADILQSETETAVTKPKEDESRPKLEVTDVDAEQVTGGTTICIAIVRD